ncbi:polysaccharide deacetylase family protein [Sporosarcina highlanderae]|uniref:Polysaccharide deacetylase n=1 Tax=Sporosarcina highlanderae TaxID=3035916 RepID=A0ABT8JME0_9BACL|nr:polysaccharide deacetylase family protein [Sporosarcina highlanderae]MDN4605968.1 polysaccharide deacetylase [Sporosarcina highlanderae]
MKKVLFIAIIVLSFSFILSTNKAGAANEPRRYIGLHDKMLPIEYIRVINGDTKVLFEDIAKFLYIDFTKENDKLKLSKHGKEVTLSLPTENKPTDSFLLDENGKLLVSMKYLADEFEFQLEYFPEYYTLRIYRDNYPHISHQDYEGVIKDFVNKKQVAFIPMPKKADVYLTFDDGPNKFTAVNNRTLKKYNAPATFFFLGNNMKSNSSIVNTVNADGHYIGTHSMSHDKEKIYKSTTAFFNEMHEGAKLVKQMTGNDNKLVRVPYGSTPHITTSMKQQLIKNGYKMWDWDVDSKDWQYTEKEAHQIYLNVKNGVTKAFGSGNRSIVILLHDRSQTTIALPLIIEWLQKEGYDLKTYKPDNHIVTNFLRDPML